MNIYYAIDKAIASLSMRFNVTLIQWDRCDGPVVRASASQSDGRWLEPRPSHTKDLKNGTRCLSLLALEK